MDKKNEGMSNFDKLVLEKQRISVTSKIINEEEYQMIQRLPSTIDKSHELAKLWNPKEDQASQIKLTVEFRYPLPLPPPAPKILPLRSISEETELNGRPEIIFPKPTRQTSVYDDYRGNYDYFEVSPLSECVFIGNSFDEWIEHFSFSEKTKECLRDLGAKSVEDLLFVYNDDSLLSLLEQLITKIDFRKFLHVGSLTKLIANEIRPDLPFPGTVVLPPSNRNELNLENPELLIRRPRRIKSSEFPFDGIAIADFNEIIASWGGREKLKGLTTDEVCNKFVKKETAKEKCSYVDHLKKIKPEMVKKSRYFVSHAWNYRFLEVVDALNNHFLGKNLKEVVVWFDLFSNNQHETHELPFDWWRDVFKSAIEELHHTVLVLQPWHNPIPLTRAWCLFEIYCTASTGSRLEIAMNVEEKRSFMEEMKKGNCESTLKKFFSGINVSKSVSSKPSDRERIFEVIRATIGIEKVNQVILEKLREWILITTEEEMINIKSVAAEVYFHQGKYILAERNYQECYEWRKEYYGSDHELTLNSLTHLSSVSSAMSKIELAGKYALEAYTKSVNVLGQTHPSTLKAMNLVGNWYYESLNYEKAEESFQNCLDFRRNTLGRLHEDSLETLNRLASVYTKQGKYDKAEELHKECLEERKREFGLDHADTLASMHHLARVYEKQGNFEEAYKLFKSCSERREILLGTFHPHTIASLRKTARTCVNLDQRTEAIKILNICLEKQIHNEGEDSSKTLEILKTLADLNASESNFDAANDLYRKCLEKQTRRLGMEDPSTMDTRSKLASLYVHQKLFQLAVDLYEDSFSVYKNTLGINHPTTLDIIFQISQLYLILENFEKAESFQLSCYHSRLRLLSNSHPDTLNSMYILGMIYERLSRHEEAMKYYNDCFEGRVATFGRDDEKTIQVMEALTRIREGMNSTAKIDK